MNEQSHETLPTAGFALLPLSSLHLNDYNARRFEEGMTPQRRSRFAELVESVRNMGVLEPLLVREISTQQYEVIAGERRYRAAIQVATEHSSDGSGPETYKVPCMVHEIDADQAFDLMVIENLQREDLTPFEAANAFKAYLDRHGNTSAAVNDLSLRTGIPTHAIRRQVRMLELPEDLLEAWKKDVISLSHVELFTRVGDPEQVLELFETCQRLKLTVRELADRICAIAPDLERGFFDKSDCRQCHHNSAVQSGLFADIMQPGKCSGTACFEIKQAAFLTDHWKESKLAQMYGTNGFRFSHRLAQDFREPIMLNEPADRCRDCDSCVSVLRLNGVVVSGYARTCVGPRACFEELYRSRAAIDPEKEKEARKATDAAGITDPAEPEFNTSGEIVPNIPKEKIPPVPAKKAASTPAEETGPVFNAQRGEKYREIFLRSRIREVIKVLPADGPQNIRIVLTALAANSVSVKQNLAAGLGLEVSADNVKFADKIFLIPAEDLPGELQNAAIAYLTDQVSGHMPVRRFIAEQIGIDLARDWEITAEYLEALNRTEIVLVGEESGIEIWRDEKAVEYRQAKYKGKALRALKKEELIDIIINSGAELKGLVPGEILGVKKG